MKSSFAPLLLLLASLTLILGLYVLVKRYQEVLLRDSLVDQAQSQAAILEQNRVVQGHGADFFAEQDAYPSQWFLISGSSFENSQTSAQFVYERQRLEPGIFDDLTAPRYGFLETPRGEIFWYASPLAAQASCGSCG